MSLAAQRAMVDWEVILVDNASTDDTAAVVERCRSAFPEAPLEYLVETSLGLSHARNRGVAAARGAYLLFTDDDVVVEPGWVEGLCSGFDAGDVLGVAGLILPKWPSPPPRWLTGRHAGVLALTEFGDQRRDLRPDESPVGANMAIRRSALQGVAEPFDARLGHSGDTYFAYEEFELFLELRRRGRLVYRPEAVVLHRILPERMTWEGMRRAAVDNGFGSRRAERLRGTPAIAGATAARRLAAAYRSARAHSRRNGGRDDVDPEAAWEELRQYWELGRWIEVLFGGSRLQAFLLSRAV